MKLPLAMRFMWLAVLASCGYGTPESSAPPQPLTGSPDIVISQLYGGGGNSGGQFTHDFVELFNRSASSVSIAGWTVQYASAAGNSWAAASLSGTIPAGGYYLVQLAAGSGTAAALPTPDATGTMNMSSTTGKVALVSNQTLLRCGSGTACLPSAAIRDLVGFGSSADSFEGSGATPTLSNTTAGFRAGGGCTDTDSNAADFTTAPRRRATRRARTTCAAAAVRPTPGSRMPAVAAARPMPAAVAPATARQPARRAPARSARR